jgi:large subunit ribosomal protein L25
MKTFQLEGSVRTELGKKSTREMRKNDMIPCVLYGGKENISFEVKTSSVRKLIYTPEIFVVELTIAGKTYNAVLKDSQFHPVTDRILHLDFLEVSEAKPIVMEVPVKIEGLAEGVKQGGKLVQEMRKLKVKAIYTNIPENLTINVSNLGLGKTIQVKELSFDNLEIVSASMNVVVAVKLTRAARGAAAKANA